MTITTSIVKQIKIYTLPLVFISFASCNGQKKPETINNSVPEQPSVPQKELTASKTLNPTIATEIDKNIRSIFQDKNGNYWFGTNGAGVYRYDPSAYFDSAQHKSLKTSGNTLIQFTVKDGLSNNQVQSIQEDKNGHIWFGTGTFGVSSFDGQAFTTFANKDDLKLINGSYTDWKIEPNDLWFYAGGGAYRYNNNSFVYLPLAKPDFSFNQSQNSPYNLSRYAVYSILKDKKGNVWFGTQAEGVCRYDGKSFTWFKEKGLSGSAVLGLFEDSKGNIWFGNNGAGLFRYDPSADSAQHKSLKTDGKSVINFTEEKKLSNNEFKTSGKSGPGTLARVYTINEDNDGNLWIGTVDSGVWRYNPSLKAGEKELINYTTKDGLTSNAVNVIYKDKNGELWFGTDGDGVCKFNGKTFTEFVVK